MDFKLDKIGVYFYNSRGASVRFNAHKGNTVGSVRSV